MYLYSIYYAALLMTVVLAILAVENRDLLHATYLMSGSVAMLALVYVLLEAPDIAITQATVGAAISTAIFIFVIAKTGREE